MSVLALRLVVDVGYATAVTSLFDYAGLILDPNVGRIGVSYLATVIVALFIPAVCTRPSHFFFMFFGGFLVLPSLTLWAFRGDSTAFTAMIFGAYLISTLPPRLPPLRVPRLSEGKYVFGVLTTGVVSYVVFILISRGGLQFINFDLLQVYTLRTDVHDQVLFGLAAYVVPWSGKVIVPTVLALAAYQRRWVVVALAVLFQLGLFGITTHKEYLAYPIVCLAVMWLAGRRVSLQISFPWLLTGLIAVALVIWSIAPQAYFFTSIVLHRAFIVTAQNHFAYYEFFQTAPLVMLSNSVFEGIVEYPFNRPVPELIGFERYDVGVEAFANTGYIASAYMQFGTAGVFVYSMLVGGLLWIIDSLVYNRLAIPVAVAITFPALYQLVQVDLSIALLTHGVGLLVFVLWALPETPHAATT